MIRYEYPFNERIRTLLRLEDLFERYALYAQKESASDHDIALRTLLDIVDVAGRADLKMDLIQELERQRQVLLGFQNNPDISEDALAGVIDEIAGASTQLINMTGKFGQTIRDNEWLMAIKGRIAIPGGLCEFDLPGYHYWLHQNCEHRQTSLEQWAAPLKTIRTALAIILRLLRSSGVPKTLQATQGQYHQSLNGASVQMALISVDETLIAVPEVSANRFALNVRFMNPVLSPDGRSRQLQSNVSFGLTLCTL